MIQRKYSEALDVDVDIDSPDVIKDGDSIRYEFNYTFPNGVDTAQIFFIKQRQCLDDSHGYNYDLPDEFKNLQNGFILDFKINNSYKKMKNFDPRDVFTLFSYFKKMLQDRFDKRINFIIFQGRNAHPSKIRLYTLFNRKIAKELGLQSYIGKSLDGVKSIFVNYRGEETTF